MTPREAIEKYRLYLDETMSGEKWVRAYEKVDEEGREALRQFRKDDIVAELQAMAEEAKREAAADAARKEAEYLAEHKTIRVLMATTDEYFRTEYALVSVVEAEDGQVWPAKYGHKTTPLGFATPTAEAVTEKPFRKSGWRVAYEVTPEEEAAIMREQESAEAGHAAAEEATGKEAAGKTAAEEARVEAAFAEARETGKPVELDRWEEECNDPREECSLDLVTLWAMPDGTKQVKRQHTW